MQVGAHRKLQPYNAMLLGGARRTALSHIYRAVLLFAICYTSMLAAVHHHRHSYAHTDAFGIILFFFVNHI